jgi:GAF domain-containing protein
METLLSRIFSTEPYPTTARKEQARLLYILVTILLIADILLIGILPDNAANQSILVDALQNGITPEAVAGIIGFFAIITVFFLLRLGYYDSSAWIVSLVLLGTSANLIINTTETDFEFLILVFTAIIGTLTLGYRGLYIIGGLSILTYLSIFFTTSSDGLVHATPEGFVLFVAMLAVNFTYLRYARASQVEGRIVESEQRFKLAEINTRITRQASERASLNETLNNTLAMILENYPHLYHAQVFLIDDTGVQARLVASTGETGKQLINKGHSLAVGSLSVIGQTTFKGEPVIVRAGDTETVHRQNELLSQTRVEAAFPLRIGESIIGALDLQSRQDLKLDEFDMLTFQSLANSLSLAIDSIRQFESAKARIEENQRLTEQTRTALREVERLNQRLIGRAWSEYLSGKGHLLGLNIEIETSHVATDTTWTDSLANAAQTGGIVQHQNVIAVPLRVRGVVVGAMEFELDEEGGFTPADFELVQEVSDRFGLAAENTRLVEESQRVAQRETLINEISTRLQSAINVEATLAEAARSLSDTLQANRIAIRLGIPADERRAKTHTNGATE